MPNGKKVLLVDDSKFTVKRLKEAVEKAGVETHMAYNGKEGFDAIANFKPDIIVTDLLMPEYDGFWLLGEILKADIDVPCLVVSADIQESSYNRVMSSGAVAMFQKEKGSL
tara:strand:- start:520 stop:852 length:333 start_codon:yes stop_codon:yes gene_type:complete